MTVVKNRKVSLTKCGQLWRRQMRLKVAEMTECCSSSAKYRIWHNQNCKQQHMEVVQVAQSLCPTSSASTLNLSAEVSKAISDMNWSKKCDKNWITRSADRHCWRSWSKAIRWVSLYQFLRRNLTLKPFIVQAGLSAAGKKDSCQTKTSSLLTQMLSQKMYCGSMQTSMQRQRSLCFFSILSVTDRQMYDFQTIQSIVDT